MVGTRNACHTFTRGKRNLIRNGEPMYIYILTNKVNSKQYIGQSVDIKARLSQHFNMHGNQFISRAIKKHSTEHFEVTVIEYPHVSKDALNAIEKWYIHKQQTKVPNGYNVTDGGDMNPMDDPEVRRRQWEISSAKTTEMNQLPENRERSRKRAIERNKSPEHRAKVSKATSEYNKKRWQDPEYRKRMSERVRGSKNPNAKHLNPNQLLLPF